MRRVHGVRGAIRWSPLRLVLIRVLADDRDETGSTVERQQYETHQTCAGAGNGGRAVRLCRSGWPGRLWR